MKLSLKDKEHIKTKYGTWALVTGASSGIGRELAERLAESGINLLLNARRKPLLEEIASKMRSLYSIETRMIEADLSTDEGIYGLMDEVEGIDVGLLVAAAGFGTSGYFHKASLAEELNMLQVNCAAFMVLAHHFSKGFAARGRVAGSSC